MNIITVMNNYKNRGVDFCRLSSLKGPLNRPSNLVNSHGSRDNILRNGVITRCHRSGGELTAGDSPGENLDQRFEI